MILKTEAIVELLILTYVVCTQVLSLTPATDVENEVNSCAFSLIAQMEAKGTFVYSHNNKCVLPMHPHKLPAFEMERKIHLLKKYKLS